MFAFVIPGEKTGVDPRLVDRAQLELRALGERECRRRRRKQRHEKRGREHPGHGPADSTPGPAPGPACHLGRYPGSHAAGEQPADAPDGQGDHPEPGRARDHERRLRAHRRPSGPRARARSRRRRGARAREPGSRCASRSARRGSSRRAATSSRGVDVAVDQRCEARDPEQHCRVEHVGADDLLRGQREEEQHREAEERPRADRGQADDEPAARADRDREELVAAGEDERRVARVAVDVRLQQEADAADDQRDRRRRAAASSVLVPSSWRSARRRATSAPSRAASRARAARARSRASGAGPRRTT